MHESQESHRTRSRAAPEWTVEESLILVNEIDAVESEWGATLPSFQKWQQIVENCNALDVARNLNQCKRKWEALLADYRRAKQGDPPENGPFTAELFTAVDRCVNRGKRSGGGGDEAEEDEAAEGEELDQVAMETEPDTDPEAQGRATATATATATEFFEAGSRKQRRRMKRKKRVLEARNPWGYFTSSEIKHDGSTSIHETVGTTNIIAVNTPEQNDTETKEQLFATMLWEKALQMNAILEGNLDDDVDYKLADLKNVEAVQIDCVRRQGDKLIDCLGQISSTLNQLRDFVEKCNS